MERGELFLILAVIGAIAFLSLQRKDFFTVRPFVKAIMAIGLAIYCLSINPSALWLMALGFGLSALGDFFLDFPKDKFFVPGLIAFFTAHMAYFLYLSPFANWSVIVCLTIAVLTLAYFIWLYPSLDRGLDVPVFAYSIVIAIMGMAALTTSLSSILIPIGALLFIASDVVLAIEKFKFKFPMDKTINWILYASGQIALAIGVTSSLAL